MENKLSKTLSIIAGSIIIIAFFLPWTKAIFDSSLSAWGMTRQLFIMLTTVKGSPENIGAYLPFILIALPIFSAIVIIYNAKTIDDNTNSMKISKVVNIAVFSLVIITLIYLQAQNPFSEFSNIFNMLGVGFYLTLIGVSYFLYDVLSIKRKTSERSNLNFIRIRQVVLFYGAVILLIGGLRFIVEQPKKIDPNDLRASVVISNSFSNNLRDIQKINSERKTRREQAKVLMSAAGVLMLIGGGLHLIPKK